MNAPTQVAGVIGDPVAHSRSPAIHNAAYRALGLDWVYLAFHVPAGRAAAAVEAALTLGLRGLSVTMPHKAQVAGVVKEASPTVARLGAANTVVIAGGRARAESTDGEGFVNFVRKEARFDPEGKHCLVAGTGGAARAVVLALAGAGARQVAVLGRNADAAAGVAALAGRRVGLSIAEPREADLVVNATPVGMRGTEAGAGPLDGASFGAGQLVVDLVYDPPETALLRRAVAGGAQVANGFGMLVHQAALQFQLFTGEPAPVDAMWAAVR